MFLFKSVMKILMLIQTTSMKQNHKIMGCKMTCQDKVKGGRKGQWSLGWSERWGIGRLQQWWGRRARVRWCGEGVDGVPRETSKPQVIRTLKFRDKSQELRWWWMTSAITRERRKGVIMWRGRWASYERLDDGGRLQRRGGEE